MSAQLSFHASSPLQAQPVVQFRPRRLRLSPAPLNVSSSSIPEGPIDSALLLKGQREILIRHGDRMYRLRHTSNDKLILTK